MKKNFLRSIFLVLLALAMVLTLAACNKTYGDDDDDDEDDDEEYEEKTEATAGETVGETAGETIGSSGCNHVYVDTGLGREPFCTVNGWKTMKCSICGYTSDELIAATGHKFENQICVVCENFQFPSEGLEFKDNGDGTCYVTGIGSCTDTNLAIPSESPDNRKVIAISKDAFAGLTYITNVIVPNGVESIGNGAFADCTSLGSVSLPKSVKTIENKAFFNCTNLMTILLPNSIETIGDYAFYHCTSLVSIRLPENLLSLGGSAFEHCSSLIDVTIPDKIEQVGLYAFKGCNSLYYNEYDNAQYLGNKENPYLVLVKAINTRIYSCEIHEDTKVIGGGAFEYCNVMDRITIPSGIVSIGAYAFIYCNAMENIVIPDSVKILGECAFQGCSALTYVTIPHSVVKLNWSVFFDCEGLVSLRFENTDNWYDWYGNSVNLSDPYVNANIFKEGGNAYERVK